MTNMIRMLEELTISQQQMRQEVNNLMTRPQNQPMEVQVGNFKLELPKFNGQGDPRDYIEWEDDVQSIFDCKRYSEITKVRLAISSFKGFAVTWWKRQEQEREFTHDAPVATWDRLRTMLRRTFRPATYFFELEKQLHGIRQGNKTVYQYYREIQTLKARAMVREGEERAISRFLEGLNRDIYYVVNMHRYYTMDDALYAARQVEKTNMEMKSYRSQASSWTTQSLNTPSRHEEVQPAREPPKEEIDEQTEVFEQDDEDVLLPLDPTYADDDEHDFVVKVDEEIAVIEQDDDNVILPLDPTCAADGDEHGSNKSIFEQEESQTSTHNFTSSTVVSHLKLSLIDQPKPYRLQWLTDSGEIKVTKQALEDLDSRTNPFQERENDRNQPTWKKQASPIKIPFDRGKCDSWTNHFQEGENDTNQPTHDPFKVQAQLLRQLYIGFVQHCWKSHENPIRSPSDDGGYLEHFTCIRADLEEPKNTI